jgi:hypothetical protein
MKHCDMPPGAGMQWILVGNHSLKHNVFLWWSMIESSRWFSEVIKDVCKNVNNRTLKKELAHIILHTRILLKLSHTHSMHGKSGK